jgi:hypothetical protein
LLNFDVTITFTQKIVRKRTCYLYLSVELHSCFGGSSQTWKFQFVDGISSHTNENASNKPNPKRCFSILFLIILNRCVTKPQQHAKSIRLQFGGNNSGSDLSRSLKKRIMHGPAAAQSSRSPPIIAKTLPANQDLPKSISSSAPLHPKYVASKDGDGPSNRYSHFFSSVI